jgi:dTDP-4-amino-4,6-dideoxygalactose transaminase
MCEMQGAVGLAQLKKLDFIVSRNREQKVFLKENIKSDKITYRKITDMEGDLADTLIFNFEEANIANKFLEAYNIAGYGTKNVPDAIDWHFSGTWNHMFANVPKYRDTWKYQWTKTAELLSRSIAVPIYVSTISEELEKHVTIINKILSAI